MWNATIVYAAHGYSDKKIMRSHNNIRMKMNVKSDDMYKVYQGSLCNQVVYDELIIILVKQNHSEAKKLQCPFKKCWIKKKIFKQKIPSCNRIIHICICPKQVICQKKCSNKISEDVLWLSWGFDNFGTNIFFESLGEANFSGCILWFLKHGPIFQVSMPLIM